MSMFQKSVLDKYLKEINPNLIKHSYDVFKFYFCDEEKIRNIEASKEEQYQEGFLRELFVSCLGYKINPEPSYNLTTEYKNISDNRKADGAILKEDKPVAIIELKGTDTVDFKKIEKQAFEYRYSHPTCKYIITSNFKKLRLYIDTSEASEEFTIFNMKYPEYERLYLLLSKDSVFDDKPLKIKNDSKLVEEDISDKLYKDYHRFKMNIFNSMVKNNPDRNKVDLLKKSQKLLDRILFIFFAEDRGLLPPNTISKIIDENKELAAIGREEPLYNTYKMYFKYIDKGNEKLNIAEYNGGLFASDELLDHLIIDDSVLKEDALKISAYDFSSDIDVNILGHIFENSLNDIDELHAEVTGAEFDKSKTKRKKDGVFYTPNYITKYIVENTLGVLCEEKKKELGLQNLNIDKNTAFSKNTKKKSKTKEEKKIIQNNEIIIDKLIEYRNYLASLKILDPACGSGAFLNQALEYLIEEHKFIDEYRKALEGDALGYFDVRSSILENNLYGVDINEESVELARLSLWLRTAERGRKLNDLSKNIKCGNSLIDDPAIAGELAFKWEDKFPKIMQNGGFDVVIGNPPYTVTTLLQLTGYKYVQGNYNTYIAFCEKSLKLLKSPNSRLGFIIPNTWFAGDNYAAFRNHLIDNYNICYLIQLPYDIFQAYIDTSIVIIEKENDNRNTLTYQFQIRDRKDRINIENFSSFSQETWLKYGKIFLNANVLSIGEKVWFSNKNIRLGEISKINRGSLPPKENELSHSKDSIYNIKWFNGQIFRYQIEKPDRPVFVNYESLRENKSLDVFLKPKILARQLMSRQFRINMTYIPDGFAFKKNLYAIYDINNFYSEKYILAILNSKVFSYCQVNFNTSLQRDDFPAFSLNDFRDFFIPNISSDNQNPFIEKADQLLLLNQKLQEKKTEFLDWLKAEYFLTDLSNKLDSFYTLTVEEIIKELKKKIPKGKELGPTEIGSLKKYFNQYKTELSALSVEINQTDLLIDKMVYELYGLTEEEIKIVEGKG